MAELRELMLEGVDPEVALANPERVWSVRIHRTEHKALIPQLRACPNLRKIVVTYSADLDNIPESFATFTKLRELRFESYGLKEVPDFIGDLEALRSLWISRSSGLTTLPEGLWSLPRFEELGLFYTGVSSLPGLEAAKSLRRTHIFDTPLDEKRLNAIIGANKVPFVAPVDRPTLIDLVRSERLPDGVDLTGRDLSGETFEGVFVDAKLNGADLSSTRWVGCAFKGDLTGATLNGASFTQCAADSLKLDEAKAQEVSFDGCQMALSLKARRSTTGPIHRPWPRLLSRGQQRQGPKQRDAVVVQCAKNPISQRQPPTQTPKSFSPSSRI